MQKFDEVDVIQRGIINHDTKRDYKQGRQKCDVALRQFVENKVVDDEGKPMVEPIYSKSKESEKSDDIEKKINKKEKPTFG